MQRWVHWQTPNVSPNDNPWHARASRPIATAVECSWAGLSTVLAFAERLSAVSLVKEDVQMKEAMLIALATTAGLAVRSSHFPSAIRAHFLPGNSRASHGVDTCVAARSHKRPDFTCHLFITYTDSVWCLMNWLLDAVIIELEGRLLLQRQLVSTRQVEMELYHFTENG